MEMPMEHADASLTKKYDHLARFYDWWWKTYTNHTVPRALSIAELHGKERVCDIGCGTGALEILLQEQHPSIRIDACDVSPGMIARAQQKLGDSKSIAIREGDFVKLAWEHQRYDAIFSLSNLHYFPDPKKVIEHAFEIAKPGGAIIILDWTKESIRSRFYEAGMGKFDRSFQRVYSRNELTEMLEDAGWKTTSNETFQIRWFWSLMLIKAEKL